nr:hypothetical protein [Tanacetum cinerariifolium]
MVVFVSRVSMHLTVRSSLSGFGVSILKASFFGLGLSRLYTTKMASLKKVGNGKNTMFWYEPWKGDVSFKNLFPRLFALELDKTITVAGKMVHLSLGTSFRRNPRSGTEQSQMAMLLSHLEGIRLPNMLDRWFGRYQEMVNILSCRVKLNNLLTRLNLSRRGMEIQSILCPSCNLTVESTNHIFFSCPMMKDLYKSIARWWDVNLLNISSHEDWWAWFSSLRLYPKLKLILEVFIGCKLLYTRPLIDLVPSLNHGASSQCKGRNQVSSNGKRYLDDWITVHDLV